MTMRKSLRALVAAMVAGCCFVIGATSAQAQMPPGYGAPGNYDGYNDEVVPAQIDGYADAGGTAFGMPEGNVYTGYDAPCYGSQCGQGCGPGCGRACGSCAPSGGCDECYNPGCAKGGWSAGGSAYILAPYAANNTAFLATSATTSTPTNFTWTYNASPAIWIGHRTAGGLKTRGRFFYYDQFSNTVSATATGTSTLSLGIGPGVPTTTIVAGAPIGGIPGVSAGVAQNRLFINAIDLETGVYEAAAGRYSFQFYAGLRYQYISSTTYAALANINDGIVVQSANYFHGFTGGGPTIFGQGYRQIGGSNFALFGNARGALLVGNTHTTSSDTIVVTPVGRAIASAPLNYNNNQNGVLPVMEIEAGLEYRCPWHRKLVFARVALVDMTFFNFGGPLDTSSNLSLLGGRASIGCNY